MEDGLELTTIEEMVLGIELSRYYPPSSGNEANYETFRRHLGELSQEHPEFKRLEEKTRELLLRKHLPEASADTLAQYCLEQQEKEELPRREVYENTAFQMVREDELSHGLEKRIFQRALATETCARWFGLGRKVDELFDADEIEEALQEVADGEIRKALLKSLVKRDLVKRALELFDSTSPAEKTALFRCMASVLESGGRTLGAEEKRFWESMFEDEPLEVMVRGWDRINRDPAQFSFLLEPMKSYFFAHVFERSGEFLLGEDPVLPVSLLMILAALEEVFDVKAWRAAAQYGGYYIIDIDYENGYKVGSGRGKNFPVSEFAVGQLKYRKIELPDSVPVSIPVPYRDPRDR